MAPQPRHTPPKAIGYLRVSTAEQADSGLGLDAQEKRIRDEAARRAWELVIKQDAGVSGATMDRPGIRDAIALLDSGQADILCVAKLDRVSRSVLDGAQLVEHAQRHGWSLVALDLGIDMSTPSGKLTLNVMLSFAQFERDVIAQRTKDAMAAAKARGPAEGKKAIGRPQALPDAVVRRVLAERAEGRTMAAIAAALTADGVPTARGGTQWSASSIQSVLKSQRAADLAR